MEGDVIIDEDGRVRRRRRRVIKNSDTEDTSTEDGHSDADAETMGLRRLDAKGRTCPFPKPTGVVGRLLGYSSASTSDGSSEMEKRIIRSEGSRGVDG